MKLTYVTRSKVINGVEVDAYLAIGLKGIFWAPDMSGAKGLKVFSFIAKLIK